MLDVDEGAGGDTLTQQNETCALSNQGDVQQLTTTETVYLISSLLCGTTSTGNPMLTDEELPDAVASTSTNIHPLQTAACPLESAAPPPQAPSHQVPDIEPTTSRRVVSLRSFTRLWKSYLSHIQFISPRADVCNDCETGCQGVMDAVSDKDKQDALAIFTEHMEIAME